MQTIAHQIKDRNVKFLDLMKDAEESAVTIRRTMTGGTYTFKDGSALVLSLPNVEVKS